MPAIITNKFRHNNAEQFTDSFSSDAYYLGIGRSQPYATSTRGDLRTDNEGVDTGPLSPVDSIADEYYYFDDMLAAKKVNASDLSYVVPRRNWTSGTVYDYYRHDYGNRITGTTTTQTANSGASNLWDATFYVLSSAFNVYKCLDNNGGANSTVEPTGTSTSILVTADGYKWKYMYSLTATQQINFLSTDFMAVATNATVSAAATDGAINIVKIKTGGTGFTTTSGSTISNIPIRGDGSSGTISVTLTGGAISDLTVTNAGSGYTYAYIRVADINSGTNSAGGGIDAELDCIIEPRGGHGFNAIKELGAYYVMLNVNFEGDETSNTGDFTTSNDFRRIMLLKNPKASGSIASSATLRGMKAVVFASSPSPGTFQVDEEINQTSTGAVGKVVEWDSTNRILYYIQTRFNDQGLDSNGNLTAFSGANVITGQTSSATGTPDTSITSTVDQVSFTSGYATAEIDEDEGDVIYVENRAPITRASDQTENVKLIIEF